MRIFSERDARVGNFAADGGIRIDFGAESILLQKHLKTTSEWPQSGPVIPLSSRKWFLRKRTAKRVEPRLRS